MSSYLLDSIAKGAQIGARGRAAYEAGKAGDRAERKLAAEEEAARIAAGKRQALMDYEAAQAEGRLTTPSTPSAAPSEAIPSAAPQQPVGATALQDAAIPAQTTGLGAIGEPDAPLTTEGPNPADSAEAVLGISPPKAGEKPKATTEKWEDFDKRMARLAAKTGVPGAVEASYKRSAEIRRKGFVTNAANASALINNGNLQAAIPHLERAFSFLPNSLKGDFTVTPDGQTILLKTSPEDAAMPTEGTNTPNLIAFSRKRGRDGFTQLDKFIAITKDPVKAAELFQGADIKEREIGVKEGKLRREWTTEARNAKKDASAESRAAEAHKIAVEKAQLALDEAKRDSAPGSVARQKAEADLAKAKAESESKRAKAKTDASPEAQRARIAKLVAQARYYDARADATKRQGQLTGGQIQKAIDSKSAAISELQLLVSENFFENAEARKDAEQELYVLKSELATLRSQAQNVPTAGSAIPGQGAPTGQGEPRVFSINDVAKAITFSKTAPKGTVFYTIEPDGSRKRRITTGSNNTGAVIRGGR